MLQLAIPIVLKGNGAVLKKNSFENIKFWFMLGKNNMKMFFQSIDVTRVYFASYVTC